MDGRLNPVTYLLAGIRSLYEPGWNGTALLQAMLAILLVGVLALGLAGRTLRTRVKAR